MKRAFAAILIGCFAFRAPAGAQDQADQRVPDIMSADGQTASRVFDHDHIIASGADLIIRDVHARSRPYAAA